jgi:hypothetical protein
MSINQTVNVSGMGKTNRSLYDGIQVKSHTGNRLTAFFSKESRPQAILFEE